MANDNAILIVGGMLLAAGAAGIATLAFMSKDEDGDPPRKFKPGDQVQVKDSAGNVYRVTDKAELVNREWVYTLADFWGLLPTINVRESKLTTFTGPPAPPAAPAREFVFGDIVRINGAGPVYLIQGWLPFTHGDSYWRYIIAKPDGTDQIIGITGNQLKLAPKATPTPKPTPPPAVAYVTEAKACG